ncbi:glycosyltransferase [Micromonospora sp. GCM10011542]|uniref:glycosyltransferase n=1 Tax=Micromonospora sp. GCM10011542 TaxID=3317337 RepID=UPI00360A3947
MSAPTRPGGPPGGPDDSRRRPARSGRAPVGAAGAPPTPGDRSAGRRRPGVRSRRLPLAYVLPLRWSDDADLAELTGYLRWLRGLAEVTVVDGSPPELFARHAAAWRGLVRHLPPDPALHGVNGKVTGVRTGLRAARHEHVVIADDDVRYDEAALREVHRLLSRADLVRPQNYFDPLPWHAWWDTGRTLLNRALGADYPGTLAVRRSTFLAMGGYDPDVLFENLELIRTVRAYGGTEATPAGLYVRRLPPDAAHFRGQRVRQAYDDLAQPARLLTSLAVVPALAAALASRRHGLLLGAVATTIGLAELGRRRAGGTAVFPPSTALAAPLWLLERGVCGWLALGRRVLFGGVRYAGGRVRRAAHSERTLRRRLHSR